MPQKLGNFIQQMPLQLLKINLSFYPPLKIEQKATNPIVPMEQDRKKEEDQKKEFSRLVLFIFYEIIAVLSKENFYKARL